MVALVVASAGSATAATLITGKQVKNGSLTGRDVKNGSLTGRDVKNSSLTGRDVRNQSIRGRDVRIGSLTGRHIRDDAVQVKALSSQAVQELQETPASTHVAASQPIGKPNPDGSHVAELSVNCPPGQVATGGGGSLVNSPRSGALRRSAPILDGEGVPRGWTVYMANEGTGPDTAQVFAICSP